MMSDCTTMFATGVEQTGDIQPSLIVQQQYAACAESGEWHTVQDGIKQ